jgi:peptidoglycan/LPS O-acetylase OafA/YrhL
VSDTRKKLLFLDGLRGLAALYVLVGHARWLLWEGYSEGYRLHPEHYSLAGKLLVFALSLFRWGHEAVLFFFVLSGFVIHLRYATGLKRDPAYPFGFLGYLARRARRLYPPLLVALAITWGLDTLGVRLQLPPALHTTAYPVINANIGSDHSLRALLRNLIFIMQPVFGSDGPLWSLNYEWYFYLLYPLVFLIDRRSILAASLVLVALSAVGFAPIWPDSLVWLRGVFQLMIVWWLGALLADGFARRLAIRYKRLAWLMLAPLALRLGPWMAPWHDLLMGVTFTGVIASCLALQDRGWSLEGLARLQPLGEMSYTLYVVHFPVLVFVSGLVMKQNAGSLPEHFGWVALAVGSCLALGWALHFLTERPFLPRPTRPPELAVAAAATVADHR